MTMPLAVLVAPASLDGVVEECDAGGGGLLGDDCHASLLQRLHFRNVFFRLDVALDAADTVGETLLNLRQFFGLQVEGA